MRSTLVLAGALFAASPAFATEIGSNAKFGIGAEVGYPTFANFSMKGWFNDSYGISARAGVGLDYFETAARFEGVAYRGQWFDWADLPLIWHVGFDFGFEYDNEIEDLQFGPEGGFGAALQFTSFNGEAFVQNGIGVYPVNVWSVVDYRGTVGFRYYF